MGNVNLNEGNAVVPSGTPLTVLSGASLEVPTPMPSPPGTNTLLIRGDGTQARLMVRMFGWNDPYYVHGSDLEPAVQTTCGGDSANNPTTGAPGIYDAITSSESLPNGEKVTGVIRSLTGYNTYRFAPVTGVTDQFGNSLTGFQFQRGNREDAMAPNYGMQSMHFPQLQDNVRGAYDSSFDFIKGVGDSTAKGWTLTWWTLAQWFTGCGWNDNSQVNCSGAGPGCDMDWDMTARMRCLDGGYPDGKYIYDSVTFGAGNNNGLRLYNKWEGTDIPVTWHAANNDYIMVDPRNNPPNYWDYTYRTGLWSFWAMSYDGTELSSDNEFLTAAFIARGIPTGSAASPAGKAMASNFAIWSGDGSVSPTEAIEVVGSTLRDKGEAAGVPITTLADNYAVSLGACPTSDGDLGSDRAYWPGMISDFRIYSGQLSTGDVRDIYLGSGIR